MSNSPDLPQEISEKAVLVSWVSVNHKAAPLLTALKEKNSPCHWKKTVAIYLCTRESLGADGDRELAALSETQSELRKEFASEAPKIHVLRWKTAASPTDHQAIRDFAEKKLQSIRRDHPGSRIVIHLSPGTPAMHAVWLALGSTGFIEGPVTLIQTADERARAAGQAAVKCIDFRLDTWLSRYRMSSPAATGHEDSGQDWDPTAVKSSALKKLLQELEDIAPLHVPVLLLGERGTGKTTLANLLRAKSPYQKKQSPRNSSRTDWPAVVCGQFRVNPELARSELFGHVAGAFTGATQDRVGLLQAADGDSLFFDEVADIDRDTQRLLMAALEGRGYCRLGEAARQYSSFRLISATNQPLERLRDELLDRDFFDRIAVFILRVPPLRECPEDLPFAWQRTLIKAQHQSRVDPPGWKSLCQDVTLLRALVRHPLTGNFRDLQRVAFYLLARLHAGSPKDDAIQTALCALDTSGRAPLSGMQIPSPEELVQFLPIENVDAHIEDYQSSWMEAALQKSAGNITKAAELLGIQRKTLDTRLRKRKGA